MAHHPDLGDPDASGRIQLEQIKQERERERQEYDAKYPEHVKLREVKDESQSPW